MTISAALPCNPRPSSSTGQSVLPASVRAFLFRATACRCSPPQVGRRERGTTDAARDNLRTPLTAGKDRRFPQQ
ncbi:MAG: hypothetical protein RLZZ460_666 [Chloroflexota bacterium]